MDDCSQLGSRGARATSWRGFDALSLQDGAMHLIIVPALGGKIASLVDLRTGLQWLHEDKRDPRQIMPGDAFASHGPRGWDEMIPTVEPCRVPVKGTSTPRLLPDHGEAWSASWHVVPGPPDAVRLGVDGTVLPFRLVRSVRLVRLGVLRLTYELTNMGREAFPCLWAAHPLFRADGGATIEMPPHVRDLVNVRDNDRWGAEGTTYHLNAPDGHTAPDDIARIGRGSVRSRRKHYVCPTTRVPWSRLVRADGAHIEVRVDPRRVPYLGIWIEEHGSDGPHVVALEPTTGYYDSLSRASAARRVPIVRPGWTQRWWLEVEVVPPPRRP